jgi:hypothetical protein
MQENPKRRGWEDGKIPLNHIKLGEIEEKCGLH